MIFIDLGAHNGDTVEQFISWGQILGDISDARVFAFEPNPNFKDQWQDVHDRHIKHVKEIVFFNEAAWVDDSGVEFNLWHHSDIGSTIMPDKNGWGSGEIIKAKSIDISRWIRQFEGEDIYMKIDIEGAEYPILKKMIEDGTDKLCKLLMIEWHGGKMGEQYLKDQAWIIDNLKCDWIEWR